MAETKTEAPVEVVALKSLTYRDSKDQQTDPWRFNYQFADRGERISVRPEDFERFESLGAVTSDLSGIDAQLALAGRPASQTQTAAVIPSEAAQVRAIKEAATSGGGVGPHSTETELHNLSTPILRLMAKAFGVETGADTSRDDLVKGLTKEAEGVAEITKDRDQRQVAAREDGTERGQLAPGVLARGRDAGTGEPPVTGDSETEGKSKTKPASEKS